MAAKVTLSSLKFLLPQEPAVVWQSIQLSPAAGGHLLRSWFVLLWGREGRGLEVWCHTGWADKFQCYVLTAENQADRGRVTARNLRAHKHYENLCISQNRLLTNVSSRCNGLGGKEWDRVYLASLFLILRKLQGRTASPWCSAELLSTARVLSQPSLCCPVSTQRLLGAVAEHQIAVLGRCFTGRS